MGVGNSLDRVNNRRFVDGVESAYGIKFGLDD